jgi:predicted Zn-dependent protease
LKGRENEAIAAWKQNLAADPGYLASRLSLADLLTRTGDTAGATEQYAYVVGAKPGYVAARIALAGLYLKSNKGDLALVQLRAAAQLEKQNASLWERIGDVEKSLNHTEEARQAWATALKLQIEKAERKRIRDKMAY